MIYKTVTGWDDTNSLEKEVNELLARGWELAGTLTSAPVTLLNHKSSRIFFVQPMIRQTQEPKEEIEEEPLKFKCASCFSFQSLSFITSNDIKTRMLKDCQHCQKNGFIFYRKQ